MSTNFLTPIALPAGTTTNAPLLLQSGTNLTTATAGAVEYDGNVIYSTPASRGVSPSMMFYRLNSNRVGSNATGAQSIFGAGITLAANTVYAFDGFFTLQKTAGTTSHGVSMVFGGTVTLNNIGYWISSGRLDSAGTGAGIAGGSGTVVSFGTVVSSVSFTSSITSANETVFAKMQGTISINTSGTLIPQYQLSAAPGGAYSTLAGSSFAIWPIGAAGANTSVGPWA